MVLERSELCGCSGSAFLVKGKEALSSASMLFTLTVTVCVTPERPDGRLLSHNETGLRYPLLENCIVNFLYNSSLIVGEACGVYTII